MLLPQNAEPKPGRFVRWLEWYVAAAVALVALAAIYETFFSDPQKTGQAQYSVLSYSQSQERATMLGNITDPVQRDSVCIPLSALGRSIDAQVPTNARIFLAGMLGPENGGKMGYYYFLNYYLFPRSVDISLGQPPVMTLTGATGRNPASLDELTQAGYDLVLQMAPDGRMESRVLKPFSPPQDKPPAIPSGDGLIAFLLPLAVALAGTRVVRWLFVELENVLSLGELLACGLALGAFFLTQGILALRMAGAQLEHILGIGVMIWAAVEIVLFIRQSHAQFSKIKFDVCLLWWLALIPAGLMLCALFRLAGTEGLLEFDSVAIWAFKAKIFYLCSGSDLWTWFRNPAFAYMHMDYPLLAPLLHTFTYGVLGHVNEFVTKFWNQWMLLLLGWAILGAGKFPQKKPWLAASVATAIILLPMTLEYTRTEGATIPLFFFIVLGSLQLAIGMAEKQTGRIRLGLLLLMAAGMVKFEGVVLLGFWGILLLLDKDSRAAFWPLQRIGLAGLLGIAGWIPYAIFRLHHPTPNSESGWLGELIKNAGTVLGILPMVSLAFVARRFLNEDFASWGAPDNQHAVWQGKWVGFESFFDQGTLGLGWACLMLLVLAYAHGGKLRSTVLRLSLIFFSFTMFIAMVQSADYLNPLQYGEVLKSSDRIDGGRHVYPGLILWFVAGFVLLARAAPDKPVPLPAEKEKPSGLKPKRLGR
jgi:hypothetical protein